MDNKIVVMSAENVNSCIMHIVNEAAGTYHLDSRQRMELAAHIEGHLYEYRRDGIPLDLPGRERIAKLEAHCENLTTEYVKLRDAVREILGDWQMVNDCEWTPEDQRKYIDGSVKNLAAVMETPDPLPEETPVQITTISITENVKQLIGLLEPDTKLEALVYEKGKAVVTAMSAKLAALRQVAEAVVLSYIPGSHLHHYYMGKLNELLNHMDHGMALTHEYQDPVGYLSLKLHILRQAAQMLLDNVACRDSRDTIASLEVPLEYLACVMEQTQEKRRTTRTGCRKVDVTGAVKGELGRSSDEGRSTGEG